MWILGLRPSNSFSGNIINGSFVAMKNRHGADDLFLFNAGKLFLDFFDNSDNKPVVSMR